MSKIIVTITGSSNSPVPQEDVEYLKEDCEDVLRGMGVNGVEIEVEVIP